ncbi:sensor histidine kinase [Mucilaginibacter sp. HMF5004]|uniref:sensor histidine kinase n=1 Tax=Mucilaginibacter rivuli TaxID=2857527 RepID=UPI001C5DC561|nr:sensor histidine kinase [Mucilaginibacter rivuli]MBW4890489.1 sensor histidine kinase [Mucilaginibacter rivuli]
MKKGWQVFGHTFFWICMIAFFSLIVHNNTKIDTRGLVVIFGLYGVINIGLFYLNFLAFIPLFLNRKKYFRYILMILGAMLALGFVKYGVGLCFKGYVLTHERGGKVIGFWSYYTSAFFTSLIFVFLSTVLKFTNDWFLNERVQRDLENQRLSAELAFLKSQINPHFLFNSLNSIYSLAYQQSEKTPDAILKLSEIMRYMLYECNDNKVDLAKEIQYLQNYIDLQKIRLGSRGFVDFEIKGDVTNQQIVPLLLISFIENAFKHGVANNPETPIFIRLTIDAAKLDFIIQNRKHTFNKDDAGGIGLNNVKRRLDILYTGKYVLNINNGPDTYTCELSLNL